MEYGGTLFFCFFFYFILFHYCIFTFSKREDVGISKCIKVQSSKCGDGDGDGDDRKRLRLSGMMNLRSTRPVFFGVG